MSESTTGTTSWNLLFHIRQTESICDTLLLTRVNSRQFGTQFWFRLHRVWIFRDQKIWRKEQEVNWKKKILVANRLNGFAHFLFVFVKANLSRGFYKNAHEFAKHVRLVWKNAKTYNQEGSGIYLVATVSDPHLFVS